jgi:hypothetical protein
MKFRPCIDLHLGAGGSDSVTLYPADKAKAFSDHKDRNVHGEEWNAQCRLERETRRMTQLKTIIYGRLV